MHASRLEQRTVSAPPSTSPTSVEVPHPPQQGKYLTLPVPFPKLRLPGAVYPSLPSPHLPALLASILSHASPPTQTTEFIFDWTPTAMAHNLATLRRFGLKWSAALAAQPFSTLTPGSEFRSADALAPLLSRHPLWRRFRERISDGADFPLTPIDDALRRTDVIAALARGNHKSARGHEAKLLDMLKDEVRRGRQLPLPEDAALELPDCEVVESRNSTRSTKTERGYRNYD